MKEVIYRKAPPSMNWGAPVSDPSPLMTFKASERLIKHLREDSAVMRRELIDSNIKGKYKIKQSFWQVLVWLTSRRNNSEFLIWDQPPVVKAGDIMYDRTEDIRYLEQQAREAEERQAMKLRAIMEETKDEKDRHATQQAIYSAS